MEYAAFRIFESNLPFPRSVWLLNDNKFNTVCYGVVVNYTEHMCGYLNIDKESWLKIAEVIDQQAKITFQGIESDVMAIPSAISKNVPVPVLNYWIGTDFMGIRPQPGESQIANYLASITHLINNALAQPA